MISKELLSEVLGDEIDIYRQAHKCKEWIVNQEHGVKNTVNPTFCIREDFSRLGAYYYLLLYPEQDKSTCLCSAYSVEELGQ